MFLTYIHINYEKSKAPHKYSGLKRFLALKGTCFSRYRLKKFPLYLLILSLFLLQLSRVVFNKKLPSESDIEKYAQDNLNIHKKGIFRKKFSIQDMLSWSKVKLKFVYKNNKLEA